MPIIPLQGLIILFHITDAMPFIFASHVNSQEKKIIGIQFRGEIETMQIEAITKSDFVSMPTTATSHRNATTILASSRLKKIDITRPLPALKYENNSYGLRNFTEMGPSQVRHIS